MTPSVTPRVGRIVHYVAYGTPGGEYLPEHRAAIITAVQNDSREGVVDLCVLNPTGMFFNQGVRYHGLGFENKGGTWHWPEREPAQN